MLKILAVHLKGPKGSHIRGKTESNYTKRVLILVSVAPKEVEYYEISHAPKPLCPGLAVN